MEYLEGPSYAASNGRKEKQVQINIQKALEYLEGGNQVSPKSSPLQGMQAKSLQPPFVGRMPVTSLVANLWIRSRWLIYATRIGEQTGIPYLRCERTQASYKGRRDNFERSGKERLIMKINRQALFAASGHWPEGENIVSVGTPKSLTNLDTGMGVPHPSGKKIISGELLARLWDSCI